MGQKWFFCIQCVLLLCYYTSGTDSWHDNWHPLLCINSALFFKLAWVISFYHRDFFPLYVYIYKYIYICIWRVHTCCQRLLHSYDSMIYKMLVIHHHIPWHLSDTRIIKSCYKTFAVNKRLLLFHDITTRDGLHWIMIILCMFSYYGSVIFKYQCDKRWLRI